MEPVRVLVARISGAMMIGGGVLVLASAFLIVLEIVLRQVFNISMPGVDELAGFALAVGATWSFGSALVEKAHIRIDTVYERLGRTNRAWLDLVALLTLGFFVATLVWYAADTFLSSVHYRTTSQSALQTPLAIPQGLWLLGLAWFLVVIISLSVHCVGALMRRDIETVARLAGITSTQEQLALELDSAESRRSHQGHAP